MSAREKETIFLRPAEVAALAGLSTRAIYRAVERGDLHAVRLCSRLRIPRTVFEDWLDKNRVHPAERPPGPAVSAPRAGERGSFRRLLAAKSDSGAAP
jgi:excisionase family DNA binding protein